MKRSGVEIYSSVTLNRKVVYLKPLYVYKSGVFRTSCLKGKKRSCRQLNEKVKTVCHFDGID